MRSPALFLVAPPTNHSSIFRALSQGFVITNIFQAWVFEQVSNNLFEKYIKTYAKLKYKASGFPPGVRSADEKRAFVEMLSAKMGLELGVEEIEDNPALRSFAKTILVNLWGVSSGRRRLFITTRGSFFLQKLGENSEKSGRKVEFVETVDEMRDILNNKELESKTMRLVTEEIYLVESKLKKEFLETNAFHNPVISSYVTAYGRLFLLETLERLGDLVL